MWWPVPALGALLLHMHRLWHHKDGLPLHLFSFFRWLLPATTTDLIGIRRSNIRIWQCRRFPRRVEAGLTWLSLPLILASRLVRREATCHGSAGTCLAV